MCDYSSCSLNRIQLHNEEKVLLLEECQQVKVDEIADLENHYLAILNGTK